DQRVARLQGGGTPQEPRWRGTGKSPELVDEVRLVEVSTFSRDMGPTCPGSVAGRRRRSLQIWLSRRVSQPALTDSIERAVEPEQHGNLLGGKPNTGAELPDQMPVAAPGVGSQRSNGRLSPGPHQPVPRPLNVRQRRAPGQAAADQ